MQAKNNMRLYASKELMDSVKEKYPEAADMSYTGLTSWAFRKLLGGI